jgi:hypothetical protein
LPWGLFRENSRTIIRGMAISLEQLMNRSAQKQDANKKLGMERSREGVA